MRFSLLLPVVLGAALCAPAFGQSAFSARGGSRAAESARVPEPAAIPPVTITKPGTLRDAPPSPLAPEVRAATPAAPARNGQPSTTSSASSDNAPRGGNQADPTAASSAFAGTGAVFRPGDTFVLRLGGVPGEDAASLPPEYTIGGDGFVNIALAGQIRAAGLTQSQLERTIERRYIEQKIFRWPTATINVPNVSRFVTVGGAVRAPSRYPWSADMTISSAIMTAGGKGEFASNRINLIRGGQIRRYDYKKIKARPAEDEHLQPGDQVELL